MKIYYTYSERLPKTTVEKVVTALKQYGGSVSYRQRPKTYENFDFREAEEIYRANVKQIKSSDIVVADISYVSSGVGYEISLALDEKKPVIVMYNLREYSDGKEYLVKSVPVNLKGNTSKYLMLKEYDMNNLEKILQLALKDAKSLVDTKFILIIPSEIDRYLEWNVKEKGISKAEITRQSIEEVMHKDEAYLNYLKENGINA